MIDISVWNPDVENGSREQALMSKTAIKENRTDIEALEGPVSGRGPRSQKQGKLV